LAEKWLWTKAVSLERKRNRKRQERKGGLSERSLLKLTK